MALKRSEIMSALTLTWMGHLLVDLMIGIWPVYKTIANLDLAIAGLIAGICPFIGEGMQIYFGSLGDKGYRKILFQIGLAGTTANAFLAFTTNYSILFFLFFITCLGSGAFHPSAVAISSSLTQKRRGLFVTIFASGGYIGFAFSQLIFSETYFQMNGNTAVLAIPTVLLIITTFFIGFQGKGNAIPPPGRRYGLQAFKKLIKCKELVILYGTQVCNQAIYWGAVFLLPDVLHNRGYSDWISFGGGHLFLILGAALIMIPGGYLADKYSSKSVIIIATISGIILFYTFLLFPVMPPALLLLVLILTGASLGVINPVAVAFGNHILPSRPGLVSAFLMGLVWCIAEGIGPGGGGLLTKCFAEDAAAKALMVLGALFFVGLIFTFKLPYSAEEYDLETDQT